MPILEKFARDLVLKPSHDIPSPMDGLENLQNISDVYDRFDGEKGSPSCSNTCICRRVTTSLIEAKPDEVSDNVAAPALMNRKGESSSPVWERLPKIQKRPKPADRSSLEDIIVFKTDNPE